jgi:hypothetical protein
MDADTGWASWRRGRALAAAEREQESERAAARARLVELAQGWDGPTCGWPMLPASSLRAGSAPNYRGPEPQAVRRQIRAAYAVAAFLVALAVTIAVALAAL